MKPEHRNLLITAVAVVIALMVSFWVLSAIVALILRLAVIVAVVCGVCYLVLPAEKREEMAAKFRGVFGK